MGPAALTFPNAKSACFALTGIIRFALGLLSSFCVAASVSRRKGRTFGGRPSRSTELKFGGLNGRLTNSILHFGWSHTMSRGRYYPSVDADAHLPYPPRGGLPF